MTLLFAVLAHFLVGGLMLVGLKRYPVVGALGGLVVLASTAVLALTMGVGAVVPPTATVEWLPALGFDLRFALDGFAVLMVLVVSVLGFGVLGYSIAYFEHDATYARFVGLFIAFAGSMTGLVLASDLFTMFVFWELTSVWSFLLIGMNDKSESARQAAVRALLTTGAGGLCLLAAVGLLQSAVGTSSFAQLALEQPRGGVIDAAVVLILLAAFTKSAQVPFHFWLPGAMAAPTPVSAYLHSATMVKAGIVLLARLSPVFAEVFVWRWWVVLAGVATMIIGGAQALRQTDAKLLLAHSTVSQLGLLTILVGIGSPLALAAGVAHLLAHAVFKMGLFLAIGVIDHEIGTRDVSQLSRARSKVPLTIAALGASGLSMAGILPLFGFVTKEKALVALLESEMGRVGVVALAGVVVGSVLSVAYSARLLRAVLRTPDVSADTMGDDAVAHQPEAHHAPWWSRALLSGPVVAAGLVSVAFGLLAARVGGWLASPASSLDPAANPKLVLWPGINEAFIISVVVVAIGVVVGLRVPLQVRPRAGALGERTFDGLYHGILAGSRRVTSVTQSGSLPMYIGVTMAVVATVVIAALIRGGALPFDELVIDSPLMLLVSALTIGLALALVVTRVRFIAAVMLGGVGYGIALLFVMRGAPDLALTQLLVETLTIVIFLLALREMPRRFAPSPRWAPRSLRIIVSVIIGVTLPLFVLATFGARTRPSVAQEFLARSVDEAGGRNVVNVILVDFRGFDTLGEITVLAIAALGVVNLVRVAQRHRAARTTQRRDASLHGSLPASSTSGGDA